MTVHETPPAMDIQFPTWNALYQIRDFVRNVEHLTADCDGRGITLERLDENTWRAPAQPCVALVVHYSVFINEDGIFSSVLNADHCYMNLAMLLFYLPAERGRPIHIGFEITDGWTLRSLLDGGSNSWEFSAANYDLLVDSPVEAAAVSDQSGKGLFHEFSYLQNGAEYRVEIFGDPSDYDAQSLLRSLQRITATETSLMQDTPFSRYTFLLHFPRGPGGGGMEHRNGTAISISAEGLKNNLAGFESVAAHEFFHAWNVKRIRPQNLEPVDYVRGNDTRELWFSEGITSTYGELSLLRSGLMSREAFYQHLGGEIAELQRRPARLWQSLGLSGREAWLEKYSDYHRPERSISYYNKGELVGDLLDLAICHASHGQRSLDDVLRALNNEFAKRGRFFTQKNLRDTILRIVPDFPEVDDFFQDYLMGTKELDYMTYLKYAGLRLVTTSVTEPDAGFRLTRRPDGNSEVQSVEAGSNTERAGLRQGDVITRLNGTTTADARAEISRMKIGQTLVLEVKRGFRTLTIESRIGTREQSEYSVEETSGATPEQLEVRRSWLEGTGVSAKGN